MGTEPPAAWLSPQTARALTSDRDASTPDEAAVIAAETTRIFAAGRWTGPIGCAATTAILVASTWGRLQATTLLVWGLVALATSAAMALAFLLPASTCRRSAEGIPRLSLYSHAAIGVVFGSFLWLNNATGDETVVWIVVAHLFAISAGVTTGLSGLNSLNLRVIVPLWGLASTALISRGHWVMGVGGLTFLIIAVADQHRTGSVWRELVLLRIRKSRTAEANAWRARHDELTGLLNRSGLQYMVASRSATTTTAMYIDLDHFKQVNDRFGHPTGDELLRQVANRLLDLLGASGSVARIGGDEFFVVLDIIADDAHVEALGQQVIAALEAPFTMSGAGDVWISASIGYTTLAGDEVDPSQIMVEADHALLQSKRNGRSQVTKFTADLEAKLAYRSGLESGLRKAMRSGGLSAAAQPIFDLHTGEVYCVELLARWRLDSGVDVPPADFVPLAEEVGLIDELTSFMLHEGGRLLVAWRSHEHLRRAKVSVNVSPVQVARGKLAAMVAEVVATYEIQPHQLMLELTESETLSDLAVTIELFEELRDLGVDLAVDDFGTGYSSLGHLLTLPVFAVKIDRSVLASLSTDPRHQATIKAVRDLAAALGQEVIVEGVETSHQIVALRDMGIHIAQGYGLCRPTVADELAENLDLAAFDHPSRQWPADQDPRLDSVAQLG